METGVRQLLFEFVSCSLRTKLKFNIFFMLCRETEDTGLLNVGFYL